MKDKDPVRSKKHLPEYTFVDRRTLLFLTGVSLSGKSLIAPRITSLIGGCTLQNMDIIRILAQEMEEAKPEAERNPFVKYGSCDSYTLIGNGAYSLESLVTGFNSYAHAVGSLLHRIIPKLDIQGVQGVMFEGVQLTPEVVRPFLSDRSKLVVVTSNESRLRDNRAKRYGQDRELLQRYPVDRLLRLQDEIIRQGELLGADKRFFVDNSGNYNDTIERVIRFLIATGVIA